MTTDDTTPARAAAPCAICGKPVQAAFRPFCSKRCADVDLQRWFTGRYAVPGREDDAVADEDAQGES
ncbi:DNA gyrase inhibitor YacG [Methylobacterium crusticola]|uniref:DNA gyrase inhibitor YacG n=1 Tax=Methylobacterium crusticola TaxID=1697972 RepID=A0ABQ4RAG4_9HYPH|nr:DNA gyrase inhibitor YacG [Methylobacterium crusticola]GJD53692.1 DNA gyrase inhibitor YacG [Methylobacterium crusticola]